MRPFGTGGTGSVRCLPRRSASAGFIVIGIRTGAGTLMRCSYGSTGRPAICGARLTMKGRCLRFFATKRRDRRAALRFLKRSMKRYGRPVTVVTDGLPSYRAAMIVIGNAAARTLRSLAQQPGRELAPAVQTTGSGNGQVQRRKDPAEIRRRPCFDPQPLQPRTAISIAATSSNKPEPPLWPSGVNWQPEAV